MLDFKFLSGKEDIELTFEGLDFASWWYVTLENLTDYNYEIKSEFHHGIHSFLSQFPPGFIVSVISITGPNGVVHTDDNRGIGWGFDITSDFISIVWVRFRN